MRLGKVFKLRFRKGMGERFRCGRGRGLGRDWGRELGCLGFGRYRGVPMYRVGLGVFVWIEDV